MTEPRYRSPQLAFILGIGLIVIGIGAYIVSGFAHWTALLPAIFGAVLAVIGHRGRQSQDPRPFAIGLGVLGLLAFLGSLRALGSLVTLVTGGEVTSVLATVSQGIVLIAGAVLAGVAGKDVLGKK